VQTPSDSEESICSKCRRTLRKPRPDTFEV
jgi:hypothetical protein